MITPETEPSQENTEPAEPDGTVIPLREMPDEFINLDEGMRGGPGILIPKVHSQLYGHKGYAAAKGMED